MTARLSWRRQLSRNLLRFSSVLLPRDQSAWAVAMRAEVAHIGDDRAALNWAAGSVGASLTERLRSLRTSGLWSLNSLVLCWIAMLVVSSAYNAGIVLATRLHFRQAASALGYFVDDFHYQRFVPLAEALPVALIALMILVVVLFTTSLYLYLARRRRAFATFCTAAALYFGVWLFEFAVPVFVQAIPPQRQWRIGLCFLLTLGLLVAERSRRYELNRRQP